MHLKIYIVPTSSATILRNASGARVTKEMTLHVHKQRRDAERPLKKCLLFSLHGPLSRALLLSFFRHFLAFLHLHLKIFYFFTLPGPLPHTIGPRGNISLWPPLIGPGPLFEAMSESREKVILPSPLFWFVICGTVLP